MRIGIDARELSGRVTGVGRYLAGLLAQWSDRPSTSLRAGPSAREHEFVLYAPGDIAIGLDTRRFATRAVPGRGGTRWEQLSLPSAAARDHLDVFFAPAYTAPLRLRIPTVVTIHDVSFAAHPEWFRLREGARRRFFTRQAALRARTVITVSEFSRGELVERFGVPSDKIRVIRHGVGAGTGDWGLGAGRVVRSESAVPQSPAPSPRVLYVGSIFNRRRVPDLIRAFAPIARAHADASLDIVGDDRSHPRENLDSMIANEGLQRQICWRRYVTDDQLASLYRRSRAFAFLSEYEGFGFTPLEALAAGVPPLLLDTPVARESCGDAALYVPSRDLSATTRALEALLFDDAARARILAAAPSVLARYDWGRAARETLAVLERAAR